MNWMQRERRMGRGINRLRSDRPRDPIRPSRALVGIVVMLLAVAVVVFVVGKLDHRLRSRSHHNGR